MSFQTEPDIPSLQMQAKQITFFLSILVLSELSLGEGKISQLKTVRETSCKI